MSRKIFQIVKGEKKNTAISTKMNEEKTHKRSSNNNSTIQYKRKEKHIPCDTDATTTKIK